MNVTSGMEVARTSAETLKEAISVNVSLDTLLLMMLTSAEVSIKNKHCVLYANPYAAGD